MARNAIQLQKGLSLSELNETYGTEEKCAAAIFKWRWPDGFVCPACGSRDHAVVGARQLYLCHDCLTQTSLKSGTIFARTLLPYVKWFQHMYLLTQSNNSISTLEPEPKGLEPLESVVILYVAAESTLGNIKSAITATFRRISEKHAPRLLAEFE